MKITRLNAIRERVLYELIDDAIKKKMIEIDVLDLEEVLVYYFASPDGPERQKFDEILGISPEMITAKAYAHQGPILKDIDRNLASLEGRRIKACAKSKFTERLSEKGFERCQNSSSMSPTIRAPENTRPGSGPSACQ